MDGLSWWALVSLLASAVCAYYDLDLPRFARWYHSLDAHQQLSFELSVYSWLIVWLSSEVCSAYMSELEQEVVLLQLEISMLTEEIARLNCLLVDKGVYDWLWLMDIWNLCM